MHILRIFFSLVIVFYVNFSDGVQLFNHFGTEWEQQKLATIKANPGAAKILKMFVSDERLTSGEQERLEKALDDIIKTDVGFNLFAAITIKQSLKQAVLDNIRKRLNVTNPAAAITALRATVYEEAIPPNLSVDIGPGNALVILNHIITYLIKGADWETRSNAFITKPFAVENIQQQNGINAALEACCKALKVEIITPNIATVIVMALLLMSIVYSCTFTVCCNHRS